jgi:hypothetical protein
MPVRGDSFGRHGANIHYRSIEGAEVVKIPPVDQEGGSESTEKIDRLPEAKAAIREKIGEPEVAELSPV